MTDILIVDDDIQLLKMLEITFTKSGYSVTCTEDGKKAIALLNEQVFDVVITDIIMPEADGIDVMTLIYGMEVRPKVIAISGGSQRLDFGLVQALSKAMKADLIIQKPVTPKMMLEAVETLMKE